MDIHVSAQPLVYTVCEASVVSRVSRSTIYRLIERGELHTVKIGDRRLVPITEVERICGARRPAAEQDLSQELEHLLTPPEVSA